jgi:phage/plasmid-associated DNA primase
MSEPGPGESLAVEVVKRLCGGDSVTGRSLYGNIETYDWTAHMLVAANKTIPSGMDYSEAIALRIRVIPFPYIFKQDANTAEDSFEKEIDFNLFKKLKGEAVYGAQYMGMAIENLKRLLDEHEKSADRDKKSLVTIPEYVQNAIKEYQQSNNPMEEFFNENVLKKRDSIILQGNIMRRFKWWIDAEYPGDKRFGRIEFEDLKTGLVKFGMAHRKTAGGRWGFHNFELKSQEDVKLSYEVEMPINFDVEMPMNHDVEMHVSNETDISGRGHVITKRRREASVEPTGSDSD